MGNGFRLLKLCGYGEHLRASSRQYRDSNSKVLMSRAESPRLENFARAAWRSNIFNGRGGGGGSARRILSVPAKRGR